MQVKAKCIQLVQICPHRSGTEISPESITNLGQQEFRARLGVQSRSWDCIFCHDIPSITIDTMLFNDSVVSLAKITERFYFYFKPKMLVPTCLYKMHCNIKSHGVDYGNVNVMNFGYIATVFYPHQKIPRRHFRSQKCGKCCILM